MAHLITGPAGQLETRLRTQSSSGTLALVCHPHPLFGGSMDNKVVTTLERYYQGLPASTVAFNFRGVGQSEGVHDHARGEVDDALAVLTFALQQADQPYRRVCLAGFSFGAYIAAVLAHRLAGEAQAVLNEATLELTLVAPVVDRYAMDHLELPPNTRVIVGETDELVAAEKVVRWSLEYGFDCAVIEGASHFFHGRLGMLNRTLSELPASRGAV